jgi:hypothetical protein
VSPEDSSAHPHEEALTRAILASRMATPPRRRLMQVTTRLKHPVAPL